MSKYIDADKFKDFMDMTCDAGGLMYPVVMEIKEYVKKQIDGQPPADVRENLYGKWRRDFDGNEFYWYCTNCKEEYFEDDLYMGGNEFPNFCPHCGADVRETIGGAE